MAQPHTRKHRRPAAAGSSRDASPENAPQFLPPLKPNRKLFYISAFLVVACFATLLTLYITTAPQLRPRGSAPDAPWPTTVTTPPPPGNPPAAPPRTIPR